MIWIIYSFRGLWLRNFRSICKEFVLVLKQLQVLLHFCVRFSDYANIPCFKEKFWSKVAGRTMLPLFDQNGEELMWSWETNLLFRKVFVIDCYFLWKSMLIMAIERLWNGWVQLCGLWRARFCAQGLHVLAFFNLFYIFYTLTNAPDHAFWTRLLIFRLGRQSIPEAIESWWACTKRWL